MTKQLGPAEKFRNALGARHQCEAVYLLLRTAGFGAEAVFLTKLIK